MEGNIWYYCFKSFFDDDSMKCFYEKRLYFFETDHDLIVSVDEIGLKRTFGEDDKIDFMHSFRPATQKEIDSYTSLEEDTKLTKRELIAAMILQATTPNQAIADCDPSFFKHRVKGAILMADALLKGLSEKP